MIRKAYINPQYISVIKRSVQVTCCKSCKWRIMMLKCWTGVYSNAPNLQRVHYTSLIKLSLAPVPHCVQRAVQRLHGAIPSVMKRKPALPQMLVLTETYWRTLRDVRDVSSLYFGNSETEHSYFKSLSSVTDKGEVACFSFMSRPQFFGDTRDSGVNLIWL